MYSVRLQDFEGPLDLLLFFIKRDELNIYDIPIARLTEEFMQYLHYMEELDLEIAGEFLVVAAELIKIKAKILLPPEPVGEEEFDPRANLIKRLVEYRQLKEAAERMREMEVFQSQMYFRGFRSEDSREMSDEGEEDVLMDVTLLDLISSFQQVIALMPKINFHEVVKLSVTIDEQIEYLKDFFERRSEATFSEIAMGMNDRIKIIVTFLALLELIRSYSLVVRQKEPFGSLAIMKRVLVKDAGRESR